MSAASYLIDGYLKGAGYARVSTPADAGVEQRITRSRALR